MGMGHRVYRVRDPRAFVLERAIAELEARRMPASPIGRRLALARAVEREAEALLAARHPDRPLRANVEFYTAVLLEARRPPAHALHADVRASRGPRAGARTSTSSGAPDASSARSHAT